MVLGVSLWIWAFVGVYVVASFALAVFIGSHIHSDEVEQPHVEEPEPADLDDWLASEEPLREFKVWRRPKAEAVAPQEESA